MKYTNKTVAFASSKNIKKLKDAVCADYLCAFYMNSKTGIAQKAQNVELLTASSFMGNTAYLRIHFFTSKEGLPKTYYD